MGVPHICDLAEQLVGMCRVPLDPLKELQHKAAWGQALKVQHLTEMPHQLPRGQEALLDTHNTHNYYKCTAHVYIRTHLHPMYTVSSNLCISCIFVHTPHDTRQIHTSFLLVASCCDSLRLAAGVGGRGSLPYTKHSSCSQ